MTPFSGGSRGCILFLGVIAAYLLILALGVQGAHTIWVENWKPGTNYQRQPIDPVLQIIGAFVFFVALTTNLIRKLIQRLNPKDEKPKGKRKKSRKKE